MKTMQLTVDNNLYDILLSMLKGLPQDKIEIVESIDTKADPLGTKKAKFDIMKYAGTINWPVDGVEYQRKIRDEEW